MNDKDKEAFVDFIESNIDFYSNALIRIKSAVVAWQAACEYKDKEIDILINHDIEGYKEGIDCLTTENKKLREALEYIYETQCAGCNLEEIMNVCREALKEIPIE